MTKPETPFPPPLALLHSAQVRACLIAALVITLYTPSIDWFKLSTGFGQWPEKRLYLFDTPRWRDGAQTNGVDFTLNDKLAITGLPERPRHRTMSRAAIRAPIPTDNGAVRDIAQARQPPFNGLRHGRGGPGRLGLERSGAGGAARGQGGRPSAFVAKVRGTITCGSHSRPRWRKTSLRSATACRARQETRGGRCCSTASTSSTVTRPIRNSRLACAKAAYDEGARLGGAVRHQRRPRLPHEVEAIVAEVCKVHPPVIMLASMRTNDTEASGGELARGPCAAGCAPDPGHSQTGSASAAANANSGVDHPDG